MSASASAGPRDPGRLELGLPPGSRARTRRLASGLRVVAAEVPDARQLRLVGAVGVGYLDEPPERRGLAHLLEHGLFLGSSHAPDPGEWDDWIGAQGGRYNAHTDERVTDVHLHLPPGAAEAGLARLIDLLCRPRLDAGHLAGEVAVLDAEFRARLDDPALHRLAALGRLCRPAHPARTCHAGHRDTLGEDIDGLTAELHAFHRRHYRAERMALAMLGPLPLDEQLALLERYGSTIPGGAAVHQAPAWRWDVPGGVAWCLPSPSAPPTDALELIWPLPEALAHDRRLEAVAARLADGRLAATLQASVDLEELSVDTAPPGTGPALALRLAPVEATTPLATLLGACRRALAGALTERLGRPPPAPVDLDAWPRRQACRLAIDAATPPPPDDMPLAGWLAGDRCRLLWRRAGGQGGAWSTLIETGTRYRPLPRPRQAAAPPERPAPDLVASPRQASRDEVPGRLLHDARLSLWWGSPAWPTPVQRASWCLGWPADAAGRAARLARWRRRTLALRQVATAQGLSLTLEADARGDWLIALGDPERLASLVEQALDAWTTVPQDAAGSSPAGGLIAQRLLQRLETRPLPGEAPPSLLGSLQQPPLLGWAGGELDAREAVEQARRFAALLPTTERTVADDAMASGEESRLPPQGAEQAVMLEVSGRDADARSRWLLQLLAACHDAAFQREMRRHHGFGYVAAVRYREAAGWPRLGYVVQSPHATLDVLHRAILDFLERSGTPLARLTPAELERRRHGLIARQGRPETQGEAVARAWQALRCRTPSGDAAWRPAPWDEEFAVLARLGVDDLGEQAAALVDGELPRHWWAHAPA
ncbi:insulinase family protein [Halomonas ramblicola]|uniref:insulinase family protein n=1 Tax=Halomonas ramblicola TaxID=747349 RepID=UPI0025B3801F|nr:insulinase family protein [Halomonas ramblicola]MDN3523392.1 insulinase family protein [Halomonas ramblicola]